MRPRPPYSRTSPPSVTSETYDGWGVNSKAVTLMTSADPAAVPSAELGRVEVGVGDELCAGSADGVREAAPGPGWD
ncbi:hypothetical protein [Streptomyces sp. NPDC088196]|uniref:hypothetical protein n=1 Tax=Streptomyces sp. NPDC088196 TaxID=3154868 RepID=UPI00344F87BD